MARTPEAWRVESAERTDDSGAPTYAVRLSAIYYGPDEDGPKVGQVLAPDPDPGRLAEK